jgi:acetolactate synthase small subunit
MLKSKTFVISAENHPDLLARTVMLLHRLAVPILALTMRRPTRSSRMRITIKVLTDPEKADCIVASLAKIVQVPNVET